MSLSSSITESIATIEKQIENYTSKDLLLFMTSSFQTHSIPLVHIIHSIDPNIPVYFIDTGFHFAETLAFKDEIAEFLGKKIQSVRSDITKMEQASSGKFYFQTDPDYCCHINKIIPNQKLLLEHDVWVNGVRASQSKQRASFEVEEKTPEGKLRYHPILNWTAKMIHEYRKHYSLPEHPLDSKGYMSIGCLPCTQKFDPTDERSSRWFGLNKTECGLHTEMVKK